MRDEDSGQRRERGSWSISMGINEETKKNIDNNRGIHWVKSPIKDIGIGRPFKSPTKQLITIKNRNLQDKIEKYSGQGYAPTFLIYSNSPQFMYYINTYIYY